MSPVPVVFIGGYGRSGSTLLDRLLGQVDGVWSMGELSYLWEMGLSENRLCGCGEPFRDCAFWREVGRVAFEGWDRIDLEAMLALRRAVDRNRFIPIMVRPAWSRTFARRLERYAASMRDVLLAVRDVSSAKVLVDSSKFPSSAFVLRTLPQVDLRVLHLVRDPRGVAFSWGRHVRRPDVRGREVQMRRYGPARVAFRWTTRNLATEQLRRLGTPYLRMRYEDLLRDPPDALRTAAGFAGTGPTETTFLHEGLAELEPAHTVHGNPMRMSSGPVRLELDDRWSREYPRWRAAVVTDLTWPMLRRYGYR
jgi:hypothetical protein